MLSLDQFEPSYLRLDHAEDVVVVGLKASQLSEEDNIENFGRELFALVEQFGRTKVVLSLNQVRHISSSVIGKMITLHRKLHRNEGALVICDMSPDVAEILYRSRLMDYFNTADDVNGALVALR